MRTIRAAAVQVAAHDRERFGDAWPEVLARTEEAARGGAQLLVLPEGTIPAYVLGAAPVDAAQLERAVDDLRALARAHAAVIVCGCARLESGRAYNSAVVVDADGTIAGYADKAFLWHFDRRWFTRAECIAPIPTSLARLGVLICADGRMPGISRALVDAGAEILVMPTAWVTSGRSAQTLENVQADLLGRVRAWENGVPFVAANKCGVERGCVAYCGKSQIVDARGETLALASQHEPENAAAAVGVGDAPRHRAAAAQAAPRTPAREPIRIAITPFAAGAPARAAAQTIEADFLIAPQETLAELEAAVPLVRVGDAAIADPATLLAHRRAGVQLAVWESRDCEKRWVEPLARARALELRMYVAVIDCARERAFAVDPDGTVVAGTFGAYRVAGFALDPRRTLATELAPGTDVADGIERIAALCGDGA